MLGDEASLARTKKNKSVSHKKTNVRSPNVVDTCYASKVDNDSEVTLLSRNVPKKNLHTVNKKSSKTTLNKRPPTQHVRNSTEEKEGSITLLSKRRPQEPEESIPPLPN